MAVSGSTSFIGLSGSLVALADAAGEDAAVRTMKAVLGSAAFFLLAPGLVAGVVPWWMAGWQARQPPLPYWMVFQVIGVALIAVGLAVLLQAFARFVTEGVGTPAPVAPTERLVVGGLYRYVRNPMYLAVAAIVLGQALVLGNLVVLLYLAGVVVAFAVFVRWYEEPMLRRRFGAQYEAYRRAVPAWWPRRHPWQPPEPGR